MPVDPKFWEASHTLHKIHQSDWTRLNSNSVFLDHLGYQMWRSCWSTSAWSYTLSFSDTTFQLISLDLSRLFNAVSFREMDLMNMYRSDGIMN